MLLPINAALLDACVLAALKEEDAYGYSITQALTQRMEVSESSVYPVLRRLQKDGCLTTYDVAISGRNRRYYRITDKGLELFANYKQEWEQFKSRVDTIFEEDEP